MNKEDLEAWFSSPITRKYTEYIQQEIEENRDISKSPILNQSIVFGSVERVEQLGIDALSRATAVRALEYAIDQDMFRSFCFGGADES